MRGETGKLSKLHVLDINFRSFDIPPPYELSLLNLPFTPADGPDNYVTKTAVAITVVQSPPLLPSAD
ncbi:MAG: hypothetical protein HW384_1510 [Dehalococcoidia bacterium]|nr:hypothetical protein [Dehalococcoidia bacterium]